MEDLKAEFLFEMRVEVEKPQDVGATPHGYRMIGYGKGGTFEGPRLKGEVLPEGGDWYLHRPDGVGENDVRGTLRTDDGHLIYIFYRGIMDVPPDVRERMNKDDTVDPSEYYLRTAPIFETASEKYGWLNTTLAVGVGKILPNGVSFSVYAIR